MNKEGKHFRTETIVTYLFIVVLVGSGIVLLKFLGGGFTGLVVYEGPGEDQTTLMLQEAGTENLMDAYVGAAGNANKNFGTSTLLKTGDTARIYMMFNISEIPANQNVDNSILCLYISTKKVQLINASHVYVHDWNEGSITWNNQPCGINFDNSSACNLTTESSAQANSASQNTWLCWNVTNMVGEDYDSGNKNASIILHTTDADINSFYSKEHSNSSLRPYLNITYSSSNPTVSITSPQEGEGFNYNTSLPLNFTITNATTLDTCRYTLNMGVSNTTIINCQNTTFNASDGDYELRLYSNDTSGNIGSDSVNFTVSAIGVSLSISEPSGTKSSRTGIPIIFSVVGNNLSCWYNVKTSIGGGVIGNTTLANCSDSSFAVSNDGDYVFNLFANNSLGTSSSTISSFTISTSSSSPPASGGGGGGGGSTTIIQTANITAELTVNPIFGFIADPGESKTIKWGVKNTGTSFLNDCVFESFGDYLSWISGKETKSLSAGEEYEFIFDLNIPGDTESGSYELGVVSNCKETGGSTKFNIEIIEKKLQLDLLEIVREDDRIRINYLLEELFGIDQNVDLEFLLFKENEKVAEMSESKFIAANSKNEFEAFINIDPSLEGNLNLLINLNSEAYSSFVQENIILGSPITGSVIFGVLTNGNSIVSYVMIFLFFIFAVVIVRRIFTFRKIVKHRKEGSKMKKNKKTGKKR